MPPEQPIVPVTPPQTPLSPLSQPEQHKFNFWETDPKRNFAPWFLKFCLVLTILGIAIGGYFKYQAYQSYKTSLSLVATSTDEFANWQTYRNEEDGFEFRYPKNLIFRQRYATTTREGVDFYDFGENGLVTYGLSLDVGPYIPKAVEIYGVKLEAEDFNCNYSGVGETINLDGVDASVSLASGPGSGTPGTYRICADKNGIRYNFQAIEKEGLPTTRKILSTFKFIEPTIRANKVGTHVTVYKDDKILFEYDEVEEKMPGNYWTNLPYNLAPSPDGQSVAYIDKEGLKIFDIVKNSHELLLFHPIIAKNSFKFEYFEPRWSADGEYILFSQAFYEGNGNNVINVKTKKYVPILSDAPKSYISWSPQGATLVWFGNAEFNSSGLWVADFNNLNDITTVKAKNIAEVFGKGQANFHSVDFNGDNSLIFTYAKENELWPPRFKAKSNLDGSGFVILEELQLNN